MSSQLLPKSRTEFQSKSFWEKFFQKRTSSFEWYGEYMDLCHVIHRYLKPRNEVLVIGCGNSRLSEELYDVGCTNLENIDISETVIKQMSAKNRTKRPDMKFVVMDTTALTYQNGSFDCVLDKGTLDAIYSDESDTTVTKVKQMFGEVCRVLKYGGRYVCVSLCQEHILLSLLDYFNEGWVIRVHKIDQKREETGRSSGLGSHLPVFIFVFTKMASIPGRPPVKVYEYIHDDNSVRCDNTQGIVDYVRDCQQYALVKHGLLSINVNEQFQMDLWSSMSSSVPRYSLRVVDQLKRNATNGSFAIFIVPQGREVNWLFSTEEGCRQLAENAGFERLVIVTLHRGHTYQGIDQVKEEVSGKAVDLRQDGLPDGGKWPILTLGDSVGTRTVLYEGCSDLNGDYIVEEVEGDNGDWIRRLVFLSTPYLAQTEVKMIPAAESGKVIKSRVLPLTKINYPQSLSKPAKLELDHTHLVSDVHRSVVSSLFLINQINWTPGGGSGEVLKILSVGLGGGALPMYLKTCLSLPHQVCQDVVDLDPCMLDVAIRWFGFINDTTNSENTTPGTASTSNGTSTPGATSVSDDGLRLSLNVHIQDGIEFITEVASKDLVKYDAIVLDVDSKDISSGLSSPPIEFTDTSVLQSFRAVLKPGGIFVTNLCARNKSLESTAIGSICAVFPIVLVNDVPESVNKIVIGLPQTRKDIMDSITTTRHDGRSDNPTTPQGISDSNGGCNDTVAKTISMFKLSKTMKRRIKGFSSCLVSKENVEKMIFDIFSDCKIHF